jgi:Protein of unknown function (DUF3775)
MKLSEVIAETIRQAQALRHARQEQWAKASGGLPVLPASQIPELPPPEWQQLRAFLRRQSPAVVYALLALMYLGRDGPCEKRYNFLKWYSWASGNYPNPKIGVDKLLSKIQLADYLERALEELADQDIDVDQLLGA